MAGRVAGSLKAASTLITQTAASSHKPRSVAVHCLRGAIRTSCNLQYSHHIPYGPIYIYIYIYIYIFFFSRSFSFMPVLRNVYLRSGDLDSSKRPCRTRSRSISRSLEPAIPYNWGLHGFQNSSILQAALRKQTCTSLVHTCPERQLV